MKTSKIGFWTIAALAASMLAAPAAYSQTERFSASLIGANEVPPINTAGTADFDMTIQPSGITFSLNFSDLSSPDHRGVDLISDALPFGRLLYEDASAAVDYAKFRSRSHDAVIRVYDDAGNMIETHEQVGDFNEP